MSSLPTISNPSPPALGSESVVVERYIDSPGEWDAFVEAAPGATFFHLYGWHDVLHDAFAFTPHYLAARRAGRIVGVLPLCEVQALLGGRWLLSLPFTVEGGVCALDADARGALDAAALRLQSDVGARGLELRDDLGDGNGFTVREGLYFGFERAIFASDEENLAAMQRKQRRMVRIGQQSGLAFDANGNLGDFYHLYALAMRRLGTPVFSRRYFQILRDRFAERCAVVTVSRGAEPAASAVCFFFKDRVYPYYVGSRRELFRYATNDFLYWELMRHARERGARVFDFGRSKKGTGAYDFKCHWGFEPHPLRYRAHCADSTAVAQRGANDPRLAALRWGWQRLPLPVTRLLGPFLVRRVGVLYT